MVLIKIMTYQNEELVWFWGGEFSNFYKCTFEENDIMYNCSEQYFMAKKALLFNDMEMYDKIMKSNNPKNKKDTEEKLKILTKIFGIRLVKKLCLMEIF